MTECTTETHESYAVLQISRQSSNRSVNLFGSSIPHNNTISLRIKPAKKIRRLNRDSIMDDGISYIEVEMSQTQFAEAITSLNMGSGTPVTLTYLDGKRIKGCPEENKRQQFEEEFSIQMSELNSEIESLMSRTKEILSDSKAPKKSEKDEILAAIKGLQQTISSNIPFVYKQFNKQMDKTTLEAKGEFEAFVQNKVNSLGVEGLKADTFLLSSGKNDKE